MMSGHEDLIAVIWQLGIILMFWLSVLVIAVAHWLSERVRDRDYSAAYLHGYQNAREWRKKQPGRRRA